MGTVMNRKQIEDALRDGYGYSPATARMSAARTDTMDPLVKEALERFLQTGEMEDLTEGQYSVTNLISEFGLKPPAAYLTISDLKKNYSMMHSILQEGIM